MRNGSEVNCTFLPEFMDCEQRLAFIFDGEEAQTGGLQGGTASPET